MLMATIDLCSSQPCHGSRESGMSVFAATVRSVPTGKDMSRRVLVRSSGALLFVSTNHILAGLCWNVSFDGSSAMSLMPLVVLKFAVGQQTKTCVSEVLQLF